MADARVTQIGRYVLYESGIPTVRVTQIARRVLYTFSCEVVIPPEPIPFEPINCPDTFLVDEPEPPLPHFLRTQGGGRQGNDPPSTPFPTTAPPRTKF